jgi:hypothetical protein
MDLMTDTTPKPLISVDLAPSGSLGGPGRSALLRLMDRERKIAGRHVVAVVQSAIFHQQCPHLLADTSLLSSDGSQTILRGVAFCAQELRADIGEFLRISSENHAFLSRIGDVCRARGLASDHYMDGKDACNMIDIVHFPHAVGITWSLTRRRAQAIVKNPDLKQTNWERMRNPSAAFGVLMVPTPVSGHEVLSSMRTWEDTTARMSTYGRHMFSDHIAGYAYDQTPQDLTAAAA